MLKVDPDWRLWWRMWSVRLNAAGLAILGWIQVDPVGVLSVWNMMPPDVQAAVPASALQYVGMSLVGLSLMARLVRQPKLEEKRELAEEKRSAA